MEKSILNTIKEYVYFSVDNRNNSGLVASALNSNYCKNQNRTFRNLYDLKRKGISIEIKGNLVLMNNEPILKILRRYSQRKIELSYKELKPAFEEL